MKRWSDKEISILKEIYPLKGADECAKLINKTSGSIRNKAYRLGIKCSTNPKAYKAGKSYLLKDSEFQLLEPYTKSSQKLLHRHAPCGYEWHITPNNLLKNRSCPKCNKWAETPEKEYRNACLSLGFDLLEPYKGTDIKTVHKHLKCGHEWKVRPHDILRGQSCPKCSRGSNYSKIAISWLNSFNNSNIQHAENKGEVRIAGYLVDGYDPITNTAYEFHGDVFHGNPDRFDPEDLCHPFDKNITAGELYEKTLIKSFAILEQANLIQIWEHDFKNGKRAERFSKTSS